MAASGGTPAKLQVSAPANVRSSTNASLRTGRKGGRSASVFERMGASFGSLFGSAPSAPRAASLDAAQNAAAVTFNRPKSGNYADISRSRDCILMYDTCLARGWEGKKNMKAWARMLDEWGAAERAYSKAMASIASHLEYDNNEKDLRTTNSKAMEAARMAAFHRSTVSAKVADEMAVATKNFIDFRHKQSKMKRKLEAEFASVVKDVYNKQYAHDSKKSYFDKACANLDYYLNAWKSAQDAAKAAGQSEAEHSGCKSALASVQKAEGAAKQTEIEYRKAISDLRQSLSTQRIKTAKILGELEIIDESRVAETKNVLQTVVSLQVQSQLDLVEATRGFEQATRIMDNIKDTSIFVQQAGSDLLMMSDSARAKKVIKRVRYTRDKCTPQVAKYMDWESTGDNGPREYADSDEEDFVYNICAIVGDRNVDDGSGSGGGDAERDGTRTATRPVGGAAAKSRAPTSGTKVPPPPSKRNTGPPPLQGGLIPPPPPKKDGNSTAEGANPFATEKNQYAEDTTEMGADLAAATANEGSSTFVIEEERETETSVTVEEAEEVQGGLEMVVALYSHDGEDADDLSFKEGDKIVVLATDESGWYTGKLAGTDFVGIFPVAFTQPVEAEGAIQEKQRTKSMATKRLSARPQSVRVALSRIASDGGSGELQAKAAAALAEATGPVSQTEGAEAMTEKVVEVGTEGGNMGGGGGGGRDSGIAAAPTNTVTTGDTTTTTTATSGPALTVPETEEKDTKTQTKKFDWVEATYDFYGDPKEGELNFLVGDRIQVLGIDDSGWWTGRIGDREGIFPASRTQSCEESSEKTRNETVMQMDIGGEKTRSSSRTSSASIRSRTTSWDKRKKRGRHSRGQSAISHIEANLGKSRSLSTASTESSGGPRRRAPPPPSKPSMNQTSSPARPVSSTGQSRRLSIGHRPISSADAEAMDRAAEERAAKLKEETVGALVGRPVSVSISARAMRMIATYDFDGEEGNELSFREGEVIDVIEKDDSGWWLGKIGERVGVFPSSRTKPYVKPVAMSGANLATQKAAGRGVRATSIKSTMASVQAGEDGNGMVHAIEAPITAAPSGETTNVGEENPATDNDTDAAAGGTGVGAENQQQEEDGAGAADDSKRDEGGTEEGAVLSSRALFQCKALYDFPGEDEADLAFVADQVIDVLEIIDDNWLRGAINGREGIFPKNFVEKIRNKKKAKKKEEGEKVLSPPLPKPQQGSGKKPPGPPPREEVAI